MSEQLTEAELSEIGAIYDKIFAFVLETVSEDETVSARELALGAMACHSVFKALERAATDLDARAGA